MIIVNPCKTVNNRPLLDRVRGPLGENGSHNVAPAVGSGHKTRATLTYLTTIRHKQSIMTS